MSSNVVLSAGVRANLLALQQTTDLITTTQTHLATGKKVNSALDNATNFFLANSFQTSVTNLNTLLDQINLAQRTLDAANSSLGFAATDVITVNDGTTNTTTFTAAANTTVQGLVNFINAGGNTGNNKDRAEIAGDGRILLEGASGAASITITTNSASTAAIQNLGFNATATNGAINNTAAAGSTSAPRASLAAQFDALRTQIDQLAADSGFNGLSLLNNQSLTVILNQAATTKLVIAGSNDTSIGLGVTASQNTFQDNFDVNTAITNINNALTTLQSQSSNYTADVSVIQSRTQFTKEIINTLQTGTNDLTLADPNQEGASLLALQTRQSLSSTALSLATQADQNVLRLFR